MGHFQSPQQSGHLWVYVRVACPVGNCFHLSTICCARVSYWNLSTHCKFKGNDPSACSQYWIMMWLCFPVLNCVGKEAKNSEALPFGTNNALLLDKCVSINASIIAMLAFHWVELQRPRLEGWDLVHFILTWCLPSKLVTRIAFSSY